MAVTKITKSVSIDIDLAQYLPKVSSKYGNFSKFVNQKLKEEIKK